MRNHYELSIINQAKWKDLYAEADLRRLARETRGPQQGASWVQTVRTIRAIARLVVSRITRRGSIFDNSTKLRAIRH